MKVFFVLCVLAVSAFALINPIYGEWERWKKEYKREYLSDDEHDERFHIFARNKRTVLQLNKKFANVPDGPRFALNQFADLTSEEFASRYLHAIPSNSLPEKVLPCLLPSHTVSSSTS